MLHVYVYDEGNRQVKVKQAHLLGIYMYDGQNRQVFLKQAHLFAAYLCTMGQIGMGGYICDITGAHVRWTKNILNVSFCQTPINGKTNKKHSQRELLANTYHLCIDKKHSRPELLSDTYHLLKIELQTPLTFSKEGRQQGHNISLLPIIGQDSVSTYQQGGR